MSYERTYKHTHPQFQCYVYEEHGVTYISMDLQIYVGRGLHNSGSACIINRYLQGLTNAQETLVPANEVLEHESHIKTIKTIWALCYDIH